MKYIYKILFIFILFVSVFSCKDDDEDVIIVVPENDRTEQQVEDIDLLVTFLDTHYYNSAEIIALENPTIDDLVITELLEDETVPSDAMLLMSAVELKTTTYLEISYQYYVLRIRQGNVDNPSPKFCDKVRVKYEGSLLDGSDFDRSSTPVVFDLAGLIPGWNRVLPEFNVGTFVPNSDNDGTVDFENYGMGVMFLPSGLGYFSVSQTGIPAYSNLMFKFELLQTETTDHDSDNIPTYMEAVVDDFNLNNKNTDGDMFPDFIDQDDDGDGTLTADEVGVETYTADTIAALQMVLDELVLADNQLISPIKLQSNQNKYTAKRITILDDNGNEIPNYLDATE